MILPDKEPKLVLFYICAMAKVYKNNYLMFSPPHTRDQQIKITKSIFRKVASTTTLYNKLAIKIEVFEKCFIYYARGRQPFELVGHIQS